MPGCYYACSFARKVSHNKQNMKQKIPAYFAVGLLFFTQVLGGLGALFWPMAAIAASSGTVVINEIAWAGSADSANDEWIELYNATSMVVDLTGWQIIDDQGAQVYALSGMIAANEYYLIEDSEAAVQPRAADVVINLSLSNTGDSLVLHDGTGQLIDAVNSSGGAWFSGNATTNATMERVSAAVSGDDYANWVTSTGVGSTATSSGGSLIVGTPGILNSASVAPVTAATVKMELSPVEPAIGGTLTVTVKVSNVEDLFSYGMEFNYDPAVLAYKSVNQGAFLSQSGAVSASFQSGLNDGLPGELLIAEARTQSVKSGVSGNGTLFTMTFDVIGGEGTSSPIVFDPASFLADPSADLSAQFDGAEINPASVQAGPATDMQVVAGAERYSLLVSWTVPAGGAEKYRVLRRNPHGVWIQLGETAQMNFTDTDAVNGGGKIIPQTDYCYRVIAVKGTLESAPAEACGSESRGLKGDNNRTDLVDGRDLENLARRFAQTDAEPGFDRLVDTTYDGQVDGSDLIDLGMNFARVYKP